MYEYQRESKRGTTNLLDDTIYLIAVFKTDAFFVLLKEELPSTSENPKSFRFKILLSMFRMLCMRINLSSEKRGQ